jgi:hypothetical protein
VSHETRRRPGSNGTCAQTVELMPPDPEVVPKAERRRFSAEHKQRILAEADTCTERGQISAMLWREGLIQTPRIDSNPDWPIIADVFFFSASNERCFLRIRG